MDEMVWKKYIVEVASSMSTTGQQLLGRHLYDILSPNDPQVMTIGNYSNAAYITFYTSNNPIDTGYNIGLCNQSFVIINNTKTTSVGINTIYGRSTLDVEGTLSVNNITTFSNIKAINLTNTTLSNINDITFNGTIFRQGKPFIAPWTNVNPTEYINTDIYTYANVGIGTTVPKYALDVTKDINFTSRLLHNDVEYRESPFQYLVGNAASNNAPADIMLSNMFYLHNVGIGTNSCNELVRYQLFVKGDVAIDGKIYANDYVSYSGAAANSYKTFELYGINPNYENKTIVTNDVNNLNTVLYEFNVKSGRYLIFMNIPYINRSPFIFVDNQNWADIVICQTSAAQYTSTTSIISKIPLEIRSVNLRNTQSIEFFIEATGNVTYTIAIRGKGHTLEFGGISINQDNRAYIELDQTLRVFPIKGIGIDDSFTVQKALQITPIRKQEILASDTSNFSLSTLGYYTATACNVDIFINGLKYVYYNDDRKDYDISYIFDNATQYTTFNISLSEAAQKDDVIDIAIWPYATADTLYSSGYYYQQINTYPTQWLNVVNGAGIRYPKDVVVDGNLIVRGNIVGGCNTDIFTSGLPTGDLTITCNVVGTLNLIDGSVTLGKLGPNSVNSDKIITNSIHPSKLDLKNKILYVGCNFGEVTVNTQEIPRGRGLYVDGDVYIKGQVQASVFQGSTEAIADDSITTVKYKDRSITYPKIAYYSISNLLIPNNAILQRNIAENSIGTLNYAPRSITNYQIALGGVVRSNIVQKCITSNEIDDYAVSINNLNLLDGYLGVGILTPSEKLHVNGNLRVDGNIYSDGLYDIGLITKPYSNIFLQNSVTLNGDVQIRKASTTFAPINRGIEIVDSLGKYTKNVFGDLYTGNIGIGITSPISGIDVGFGNVLIRSGSVSIGRTSINTNITIDAFTPPNSTMLINNVGIGTDIISEKINIYGGGLLINSNETYFSFTRGNVGIGTLSPIEKLHIVEGSELIDNGDLRINNGNIDIVNGSINITTDDPYNVSLYTEGISYVSDIYTSNIISITDVHSIGAQDLPYLNTYTCNLIVGNTTSVTQNTVISHAISPVYKGDGYNVQKTITGGIVDYLVNPPLQINNNLYVNGFANFTNFYPFRNLAINGNMTINQRYTNTSATISQTTPYPTTYTLDRYETVIRNSTAQLLVLQSNITNNAAGFVQQSAYYNCKVGVSTSSLNTIALHTLFSHKIENILTSELGWGTSSPLPITVSFDAISTLSHTYYLAIQNIDRTRSYIRDVAITASTTPNRYAFTISGDNSTSANWRNPYGPGSPNIVYGSNDTGIVISLNTGVGATYVNATESTWLAGQYYGRTSSSAFVGTINTNLNITNFQVEVGYHPTVFEKRPVTVERILCERYYEKSYNIDVKPGTANTVKGIQFAFAPGTASFDWICGTVPFRVPKKDSEWIGRFWNFIGTESALSVRQTSGIYAAGAFGTQPAASNTVFGTKGDNSFGWHTLVSAQQGRNYAFHWTVDSEL